MRRTIKSALLTLVFFVSCRAFAVEKISIPLDELEDWRFSPAMAVLSRVGDIRVSLRYNTLLDPTKLKNALHLLLRQYLLLGARVDRRNRILSFDSVSDGIYWLHQDHQAKPPEILGPTDTWAPYFADTHGRLPSQFGTEQNPDNLDQALFAVYMHRFMQDNTTLVSVSISHAIADAGGLATIIDLWSKLCEGHLPELKPNEAIDLHYARVKLSQQWWEKTGWGSKTCYQEIAQYEESLTVEEAIDGPEHRLTTLLARLKGSPKMEAFIDGARLEKLREEIGVAKEEASSTAVLAAVLTQALGRVAKKPVACDLIRDLRRVLVEGKYLFEPYHVSNAIATQRVIFADHSNKENLAEMVRGVAKALATEDPQTLISQTQVYEKATSYIGEPAILMYNLLSQYAQDNALLISSWRGRDHDFLKQQLGSGQDPVCMRAAAPEVVTNLFFAVYPLMMHQGHMILGMHGNLHAFREGFGADFMQALSESRIFL